MRVFAAILIFAATSLATNAFAECPPEAEQSLFEVKQFVDNPGISNSEQIKEVFAYANEGLTNCNDRADVQALTAYLFAAMGNKLTSNKDKAYAYKLAHQAVVNNSKAYDNKAPTLEVKFKDGSKKKLYTYNLASQTLKNIIVEMANLH